jgi:hypothetical protein
MSDATLIRFEHKEKIHGIVEQMRTLCDELDELLQEEKVVFDGSTGTENTGSN